MKHIKHLLTLILFAVPVLLMSMTICAHAQVTIITIGYQSPDVGSTDIHEGCKELQKIGNDPAYPLYGQYVLASDIDCTGIAFVPIGNDSHPFTGTFDGKGHTIKGLNINLANQDYVGLFGYASSGWYPAWAMNLNLDTVYIRGGQYTGALVGKVDGVVSPIVHITINNADIAGSKYVGGLVGYSNASGIITSSTNNVKVNGDTAGGLVGWDASPINQCSSSGIVSGTSYAGGLVGYLGANFIVNSYSLAQVEGSNNNSILGGLVGSFSPQSGNAYPIHSSYAAGKVDLTLHSGGIVGQTYPILSTAQTYWDINTTGQSSDPVASDMGKTTVEMQQQSTFSSWDPITSSSGWDFNKVWYIVNAQGYPILKWQLEPGASLWNTASVLSRQPELFSVPLTGVDADNRKMINWDYLGLATQGVNWQDIMVLSTPRYWSNTPADIPGAVNWLDLFLLSSSGVNWTDLSVLTTSGINWASINPMIRAGINWTDWAVLSKSGINYSDVAVFTQSGINWGTLSIEKKTSNHWSDWATLSKSAVNWSNISTLSNAGINWNNVGVLEDPIDWADVAALSQSLTSWSKVSNLSHLGTDWDNINFLNTVPMTTTNLFTLREIGVNTEGSQPTGNVLVNLNLSGFGSSTTPTIFTSVPPGINCQLNFGVQSGTCVASFPKNQFVNLNASYPFGTTIHWGINQCDNIIISNYPWCTFAPDSNINLNIGVAYTPADDLTINLNGNGHGNISVVAQPANNGYFFMCSSSIDPNQPGMISCNGSYIHGTQLTLTATPVAGSIFKGWTGIPYCANENPCTTTINSSVTGSAEFDLTPISVNVVLTGPGQATFVSTPPGINCSLSGGTGVGTCYGLFQKNQPLTLTATNVTSTNGIDWMGYCDKTATSCTITPSPGGQNWNIQVPPPVALNINVSGNGQGLIGVSPISVNNLFGCTFPIGGSNAGTTVCHGSFTVGTQITLTATPVAGSVFKRWTGIPGCSIQSVCRFTINNNLTAGVQFDAIPPVISNGQPTGNLPVKTKVVTLSVNTNEQATCRYSTIPNTAYLAMTNTMDTTNGTTHTKVIPVSGVGGYSYYVRCADTAGNADVIDYSITFQVGWPQAIAVPVGSMSESSE